MSMVCVLASLFYLVPGISLNSVLHGIAGLVSVLLIYHGVASIFRLKRRGAAAILTLVILSAAALGFGIFLIGTLMYWGAIQNLQFSLK